MLQIMHAIISVQQFKTLFLLHIFLRVPVYNKFFPMYPFFWSVKSRQNLRNWFPSSRDDALVSYSMLDTFQNVFGSITIRPIIFIINFGQYLLSQGSSHSIRTQTPTTPLSKTNTRKILFSLLCAKADSGSHVPWKCPEKRTKREEHLNNRWPRMKKEIAFRTILAV